MSRSVAVPLLVRVEQELDERRNCTDSKSRMSSRKPLGSRRPAVTATIQVTKFGKAVANLTETTQEPLHRLGPPNGLRYVVRKKLQFPSSDLEQFGKIPPCVERDALVLKYRLARCLEHLFGRSNRQTSILVDCISEAG